MKLTAQQKADYNKAVLIAKNYLKPGDKVGCTKCAGVKSVFTFIEFDGCWMVSKSGINDFHPYNVYSVNGVKVDFKTIDWQYFFGISATKSCSHFYKAIINGQRVEKHSSKHGNKYAIGNIDYAKVKYRTETELLEACLKIK